jgi:type IV fimbrial biogenesis protein FimT
MKGGEQTPRAPFVGWILPLVVIRLADGRSGGMMDDVPLDSIGATVVPGTPKVISASAFARARRGGFTIVELMITLAVAAILLMIAVPSFKHVIADTNLAGVNNDLSGDLQYARTVAASRQVDVAVAQSSGGSWQDGWNVEIPASSSTGTPEILRVHSAVSSSYTVAFDANGGASSKVTFQPQGSIDTTNNTGGGVCFTISANNGEHNNPQFLQVVSSGSLQQTTNSTTAPTTGPACINP